MIRYIYGNLQLVFTTFQTLMVSTRLAFWASLDTLPFILNLLFNFAFTPIQFGLKNNLLAALDIVLVLGTLIWALCSIWRASTKLRWVVYANIPYLLWVTFATCLQLTITYLNR